MGIKLTISIVNWNTKDYLRDCLTSIRGNVQGLSYEVIVVDNASHDASAQMVKEQFPEVILIENNRNLNYAKANNQAFKLAQGNNFLLLNPDTVILKDAVKELCDFLDNHPEAGAVAPQLLNPDGTFQLYCQRFPHLATMIFVLTYLRKIFPHNHWVRHYYMRDVAFDKVMAVQQPAASCLLVRKGLFKENLFDERFPFVWNDVDLCKRINDLSYKIYFVPSALILHHKSVTVKMYDINPYNPTYYQSVFRYFIKHKGFLQFFILWLIVTLNQILYCVSSFFKLLFKKNTMAQFKSDVHFLLFLFYPWKETI